MAKKRKKPRNLSIPGFEDRDKHGPLSGITGFKSSNRAVTRGKSILDANDELGTPHRVNDVLRVLKTSGRISSIQFDAGKIFEQDFAQASLVGVRAVDWMGSPGGNIHGAPNSSVSARERVWGALSHLGGGLPADVAWHVLGLGENVKEYAAAVQFNNRSVNPLLVTGLLIGVCGSLVGYYRI